MRSGKRVLRCRNCDGRGWVTVYRTRRTPRHTIERGFLERIADFETDYLDLAECASCVGSVYTLAEELAA